MSVTAVQFTCSLDNVQNDEFKLTDYYALKGNKFHGQFTLIKNKNEDAVYIEIIGNYEAKRCGYKLYVKYLEPIGTMRFSRTKCFGQQLLDQKTKKINQLYPLWSGEWEAIKSASRIILTIKYDEYPDKSKAEIEEEEELKQEVMRQRQLDPSYINPQEIKEELDSWSEEYKAQRLKETAEGEAESM